MIVDSPARLDWRLNALNQKIADGRLTAYSLAMERVAFAIKKRGLYA